MRKVVKLAEGKNVNQHGVSLRDYFESRLEALDDKVAAIKEEQRSKNIEFNDVRHRFLDRNEADLRFSALNRLLTLLLITAFGALVAGLVNLLALGS